MGAVAFFRKVADTDAGLLRLARTPPMPLWRNLLVGFAWAAAVLSVRAAASTFYGDITGFMILLPGVILAALSAGRAAGLASLVTCLIGGWMVVHLTGSGVSLFTDLNRVGSFNFLVVGTFAVIIAASLRKTLGRLDAAQRDARTAAAALRRSDTQLEAMIDQASAGIARVSLDGQVVSANQRFADILGYTTETAIGINTRAASHPEDVEPTLKLLQQVIAGGPAGQIEKRYMRPDGRVVWGLTSLGALTDENGDPAGYIAVVVDITDTKTAEAALRESEERFRLMADTAPSPVWLTNEEGEVQFVNAALVEFYGRPADDILGHVWKMAIHPDDQAGVAAVQAQHRPKHEPYAFECRFARHDGAWRWMNVSVNPRFDGERQFRGYVGLSFDVTESHEALDALARQDRRQRFLLQMADGLRDLSDPRAVMDHVNRLVGEDLGVVRAGFGELDRDAGFYRLYRDWTDGVPSSEGDWPIETFGGEVDAELARGMPVIVEDVAADPRTAAAKQAYLGISVRSFVSIPLMRGGRLRAFMNVHSATPRVWTAEEIGLLDETAERAWSEVERTRAQAEVAESEARFRAIADTAPVLIWVTQQNRQRAFVNQAYVAFMGGDYESVRTADWRTFIHPDDQEQMARSSQAGEATGEPFSLEARYKNSSGEYRWLKSFSRPRLASDGEVAGFVGVAFDVTDAKRAETDLKRINELLEDRVGEALAEKAKAEADLMHAQRMEAVGRLTGGVAHDFNNLLTVVIGALDMILRSPDDAARRKKLGEAALAAARRGEGLTHQLLAFSRRQALRPELVDLNTLIRESEPLLRRAVDETVSFKIKLKRGGVRVSVDPSQFEAALLNLIVNARDAIAEGGSAKAGSILIETQACEVEAGEVAELAAGTYVCVSVTDNGAGMDAATMARVFEPFFTTKSVGKGTGLGLSQVYGFARQSGGGVRIRSGVGEGAEIRLYLPPLARDAAVEPKPDAALDDILPSGRRLLLVEDDTGVAAVAMELLEEMGLDVVAAETGPEALRVLGSGRFDVMLSDVVMPGGMTGIELARQCAVDYPDLRILLTSGYAGDDVDEALSDAPWSILRKPYSAEQLRRALGEVLPLDE